MDVSSKGFLNRVSGYTLCRRFSGNLIELSRYEETDIDKHWIWGSRERERETITISIKADHRNCCTLACAYEKTIKVREQKMDTIYARGLKLKLVGGPHSREKMLRGPQFIRKKLFRATKYKKSPQNKL